MNRMRRLTQLAALLAFVPLTACSDVLSLNVEAPGRISDTDLNNAGAMAGIAAGASYNLTSALDATVQKLSMAALDLGHGGSYDFGGIPIGIFKADVEDWGEYTTMSRARWTAEHGLLRMKEVLGATEYVKNVKVAKAYLMGGFASRHLGEVQWRVSLDDLVDGAYV